jgi:hypothetical protein
MIDLDLSNFKPDNNTEAVNLAKSKKFEPAAIIWSGNGYHLYIPAQSQNAILEQMSEFNKYKEPSNVKADSEHYHTVSFKNCLLRAPGSYNSKNMSQVKIVQKWNGTSKVALHLLYDKFLA